MSMSNAAETLFLELLFNNDDWVNIGNAGGILQSTVDGVFWIRLHTGDPGEAGNQSTSEADYTGYGAESVARTAAGFTVAGNNASNAAEVAFDPCTGGTNTITHFSFGTDETGAGNLIGSGTVTPNLAVSNGITPSFAIGTLDVNMD